MLEVHPWYTPTTISVALLLTSIYVVCFRGIQGIIKRGKSKKKKILVISANELTLAAMVTRVTPKISFCSLLNRILANTTAGGEAFLIYTGCFLSGYDGCNCGTCIKQEIVL